MKTAKRTGQLRKWPIANLTGEIQINDRKPKDRGSQIFASKNGTHTNFIHFGLSLMIMACDYRLNLERNAYSNQFSKILSIYSLPIVTKYHHLIARVAFGTYYSKTLGTVFFRAFVHFENVTRRQLVNVLSVIE